MVEIAPPNAAKEVLFQPKQQQLLELLEATGLHVPTWLGYGGARGGGKSAAIRYAMLKRRLSLPNTTGIIVRRVFDDVKKNHIDPLFREFPNLQKYYRVSDHELRLPNGSVIVFGYAETAAEVNRKFWGVEYVDIFVDQAEQFNGDELTVIKTTNRWPGVEPGLCKTALFFNPGGCGTEFLRRVFYLKQYKQEENHKDYHFIQAYGWDNYEWFRGQVDISLEDFYALPNESRFELFITETSEGRKMNALPPSLRTGHLLGSFDAFKGQYFAGVWDESKVILTVNEAEALIQPWWNRWIAQDWGFADHAATLWFATGKLSPQEFSKYFGGSTDWPIDVVICYRELVVNETAEADLASMIVELTPEAERKHLSRFFLSKDAFNQRASVNSVSEIFDDVFALNKMPRCEPADQDRINGWRFLYNTFRQTSALRGAAVDIERAKQGPLLFISANCPEVISCVPLAVRDEKKPEDVMRAATLWEDVTDALRYGVKSMLDAARKPAAVRAHEVYEAAGQDMNAKAMAMRLFKQREEKTRYIRNKRAR